MVRRVFYIASSFLLLLLLVLLTFTVGPAIEARFWPVVDDVYVTIEERTDDGVTVLLSYSKNRDCKWEGVAWYYGKLRLPIDFQAEARFFPRSRTVGEHLVGPWTVQGLQQLEGTRAEIYHTCHPFWAVHNVLYPPQDKWTRRQHTGLLGPRIRYVRKRQVE